MHSPALGTRRVYSPCSHRHQQALEQLFRKIGEVSTLPVSAQRALELASNPASSLDCIYPVIQRDPSLAAQVLRRVNSAFFGFRGKIGDLRTAIMMLGLKEVRNLCLTVFVSRLFSQPGSYRTYNREKLWQHCVAVAAAARKIARVTGASSCDEAYAAGLLHHLGTILLDQHLRSHFCNVLDHLEEWTPTFVKEHEVYSFDQGQLGEYIALQWQFPKHIAEAVRYYAYPDAYTGPNHHLIYVVSLANYMCSRGGVTSLGIRNTPPPPQAAYTILGLDDQIASVLWEEVEGSLNSAAG